MLIRVVHHGDEHIEEHHQGDDVIRAEHRGTHKLCELVVSLDVGHVQANQAEYGPEQRLQCFKQPRNRKKKSILIGTVNLVTLYSKERILNIFFQVQVYYDLH